MLKFMLDTNICIFTIKNKPASVRERFNLNHPAQQIHHVVPLYPHYGHRENRQCERNFFNGIPRPGSHKGGNGVQVIPQPLTTGNHINFIHRVLPPK